MKAISGEMMIPTLIGERVRFVAYGGKVRLYMVGRTGVVIGFTTHGNPVIRLDRPLMDNPHTEQVVDRFDCARCITEDGNWERPYEAV